MSKEEFNSLLDVPRSHVSAFARNLLLESTSNDYMRRKELEGVEAEISTLHQLSLGIRKASNRGILVDIPELFGFDTKYAIIRERRDAGVDSGTVVDSVRFDIGNEFAEYVRKVLTHKWLRFRSSDEEALKDDQKSYRQTLLDRCVPTVSARRRQLAYFQAHQSRLKQNEEDKCVVHPEQAAENISTQKNKLQPPELPRRTDLLSGLSQDPSLSQPSMPSDDTSNHTHEEVSVSDLAVKTFKPSLASFVLSSSTSTTADGGYGGGGQFHVPPPPKLVEMRKRRRVPTAI